MSHDRKIATLLAEVTNKNGCKVSSIQNGGALEFIDGLKVLYKAKKKPHMTRSAEILQEEWDIEIPRRRLSDHVRGDCGCLKK